MIQATFDSDTRRAILLRAAPFPPAWDAIYRVPAAGGSVELTREECDAIEGIARNYCVIHPRVEDPELWDLMRKLVVSMSHALGYE